MVEMGVLLDWICVASIKPAAQAPPLIQMAAPLVTPLADGSLLSYLSQVVWQWLPGLLTAPVPPQLVAPALQVCSILQQMADDQQAHHQAAEVRQASTIQKTPTQCWNQQTMAVLYATMGTMQDAPIITVTLA